MKKFLLPIADYQRIYESIYSVLESSGMVTTEKSCFLFSAAGACILNEHYGMSASCIAGSMALATGLFNQRNPASIAYGRLENGSFVADEDAFHAWVECGGWHIAFMSPLYNAAYLDSGYSIDIPNKMMQKPTSDRKGSLSELLVPGDFYASGNVALGETLLEDLPEDLTALLVVCVRNFVRPPAIMKLLPAPSFNGAW